MTEQQSTEWRFYGRRAGRKLNAARQAALDDVYPQIAITGHEELPSGTLDPASLFNGNSSTKPERFILEIGFGNGERLAQHIQNEPRTAFIGAEPFSNGMSAFLSAIKEQDYQSDNIRVLMDDAIPLVKALSDQSIDSIYVLNPDPWHKTRHHKRRIINPDNLNHFSRILKPGGDLIMTTDVEPLAGWMATEASLHPDFIWSAQEADDWRCAPKGWIPTRYETKRAKGAGKMNYLFFKKQKTI